jgi:hypothetical protein
MKPDLAEARRGQQPFAGGRLNWPEVGFGTGQALGRPPLGRATLRSSSTS